MWVAGCDPTPAPASTACGRERPDAGGAAAAAWWLTVDASGDDTPGTHVRPPVSAVAAAAASRVPMPTAAPAAAGARSRAKLLVAMAPVPPITCTGAVT